MKRKLKYLCLALEVMIGLKLVEMYHNVYPQISSEACVDCHDLDVAPNGKTVNLFFRETLNEGWFEVNNLYYKQNFWDKRKQVGQSFDYNGGNKNAGLEMRLYFSSCELPPYITHGIIIEEDFMTISDVHVSLMKGAYDDAATLFYYFKFQSDSLYVSGKMKISRRDEKQFSSDEEKKDLLRSYLEKMFWSSPA